MLCQKIRHGIPLAMSGRVFSGRRGFGNALIVEGIRATKLSDTAWRNTVWSDFQSSANPLSTTNDKG